MDYLYILQQALIGIITLFWLYNIAISVCSLIKFKEKPLLTNKQHKFMAIIPAHNEEKVVKNLIESLKEQNYPKELLDILNDVAYKVWSRTTEDMTSYSMDSMRREGKINLNKSLLEHDAVSDSLDEYELRSKI